MRTKKIALLTISLLVIWIYPCSAQQRTIERIYISTDRALYIAGETIWLSLYCFDLSKEMHQFSDLSKVAYVELRNAGSLVTSAKLRIDKGRGGGMLQLPASLPTGNYRLIAYTKQMLNEATPCFFDKVIPIYNTLSTERIDENVFVGDDLLPQTQTEISRISSNHIDVKWNGDKIVMTNKSDQAITLNLSIARVDIPVALDRSIIDFMEVNKPKQAEVTFNTLYIPEYEGEIIRGRVKNVNGVQSREHLIFLSTVGTGIDIYSATADAVTGEFSFFTKSLLEKNEIVLEYPGAAEATFELIDPFVRPPVAPAPPLFLDKTFESALVQRSMEMQVSKYFGIDTLFERVNVPDGPPLFTGKPIIYHLDDYTRFPTMQDIVIEFVSGTRLRRANNQSLLQIAVESDFSRGYTEQNALVLIDGIAIFDHERLFKYDLLKAKTVSIYHKSFRIGSQTFDGLAALHTYKGTYQDVTLGKNSVILDFDGVLYPTRFTGREVVEMGYLPDVCSLLYWDPLIHLPQDGVQEISIKTPSKPGTYTVEIEGTLSDGRPVLFKEIVAIIAQ